MSARGGVVAQSRPLAADDRVTSPGPPRRRRPLRTLLATRNKWWAELLLIAISYLAYNLARLVASDSRDQALAHGRVLWNIERMLGIAPERWMNKLLTGHRFVETAVTYYYQTLHFVVTPLVLLWLFKFLPKLYPFFRSSLLVGSATAVIGFWFYPTAPPRFAISGFADTVAHHGAAVAATTGDIGGMSLINIYAAMPSLHVGWAAWCALAVTLVCRRRVLRFGVWLYPLTTALVVFATANHYVLDAAVGVAVMAVGCVAALAICGTPLAGIAREPTRALAAR